MASNLVYVVFRIGSNGANQPGQQEMALATVEATTKQKAWIIARNKYDTKCYSNQRIEVRNRRFVPADVWNALQEKLGLEATYAKEAEAV